MLANPEGVIKDIMINTTPEGGYVQENIEHD
jgi:hypothetical protein